MWHRRWSVPCQAPRWVQPVAGLCRPSAARRECTCDTPRRLIRRRCSSLGAGGSRALSPTATLRAVECAKAGGVIIATRGFSTGSRDDDPTIGTAGPRTPESRPRCRGTISGGGAPAYRASDGARWSCRSCSTGTGTAAGPAAAAQTSPGAAKSSYAACRAFPAARGAPATSRVAHEASESTSHAGCSAAKRVGERERILECSRRRDGGQSCGSRRHR